MKLYKINDKVYINAEQITGLEAGALRTIEGEQWIIAYDNSTVVHLQDGRKIEINRTLKKVISELKAL